MRLKNQEGIPNSIAIPIVAIATAGMIWLAYRLSSAPATSTEDIVRESEIMMGNARRDLGHELEPLSDELAHGDMVSMGSAQAQTPVRKKAVGKPKKPG